MTRYLGDIIVVEHIKETERNGILLPQTMRSEIKLCPATVLAIGKVTKRQHGKYYAADDLQVGDTVLVHEHLGTRGRIPDNPNAIIYDTEDCLALLV